MIDDPKDLAHKVNSRAKRRLAEHGMTPWQRADQQMLADLSQALETLAEQLEKERARHVPEEVR